MGEEDLETIEQSKNKINRKTKLMICIGIGIVILGIGFLIGTNYNGHNTDNEQSYSESVSVNTDAAESSEETDFLTEESIVTEENSAILTTVTQTTTSATTTSTEQTITEPIETTVQTTTPEQTAEQRIYEEYYNNLLGHGFMDGNGGYMFDMNNDGIDEILFSGDAMGYYLLSYNNGVIDGQTFFILNDIKNSRVFVADGYIYCRHDEDNESTQLYYNPANEKEMTVETTYTMNSDNTYNADWTVRSPELSGGVYLGMYDWGNSIVTELYAQPEECDSALALALADCDIYLSDSSLTELEYMTYNELKIRLLDLSGKSSQLVDSPYSEEALQGHGYVNTESGSLNLRSAPSISSDIVASIPNGTEFEVMDDSNEGWLYVWLWVGNELYAGYLSEEYTVWSVVYE